jgi:hypothetical protein
MTKVSLNGTKKLVRTWERIMVELNNKLEVFARKSD